MPSSRRPPAGRGCSAARAARRRRPTAAAPATRPHAGRRGLLVLAAGPAQVLAESVLRDLLDAAEAAVGAERCAAGQQRAASGAGGCCAPSSCAPAGAAPTLGCRRLARIGAPAADAVRAVVGVSPHGRCGFGMAAVAGKGRPVLRTGTSACGWAGSAARGDVNAGAAVWPSAAPATAATRVTGKTPVEPESEHAVLARLDGTGCASAASRHRAGLHTAVRHVRACARPARRSGEDDSGWPLRTGEHGRFDRPHRCGARYRRRQCRQCRLRGGQAGERTVADIAQRAGLRGRAAVGVMLTMAGHSVTALRVVGHLHRGHGPTAQRHRHGR